MWFFKVTVILPSCCSVITTVGLHYFNPDETLGELQKNDACCFQQILKASFYKAAIVRPLTSHLTHYLNYTLVYYQRVKSEPINDVLLWTPDTRTHQCWLTRKNLHSSDTGCRQENLPRGIAWCQHALKVMMITFAGVIMMESRLINYVKKRLSRLVFF